MEPQVRRVLAAPMPIERFEILRVRDGLHGRYERLFVRAVDHDSRVRSYASWKMA